MASAQLYWARMAVLHGRLLLAAPDEGGSRPGNSHLGNAASLADTWLGFVIRKFSEGSTLTAKVYPIAKSLLQPRWAWKMPTVGLQ